jgi:hypothetical protein
MKEPRLMDERTRRSRAKTRHKKNFKDKKMKEEHKEIPREGGASLGQGV